MHWAERYTSRPFMEGDCGDLARIVNRDVFGRGIRMPSDRAYKALKGCARVRAMVEQIDLCKQDSAQRTDAPREGDGVLLISRGVMSHIGVHCAIHDEAWVLHMAPATNQPVLMRVRDVQRKGYRIEGYYRWL